MKMVFISQMYPTINNPTKGVFVEDQVYEISKKWGKPVNIIVPIPFSIPLFERYQAGHYNNLRNHRDKNENNLYFAKYLNVPGRKSVIIRAIMMNIAVYRIMHNIASKNEKNIIHIHSIIPTGLIILILKNRFKNSRFYCTVHGSDFYERYYYNHVIKWIAKKAIRKYNRLISVSRKLYEQISSEVNYAKITVIPNGHRFLNNKTRDYSRSDLKCLYVGQVTRNKGIIELLEVFSEINEQYPEMQLILAGKIIGDVDIREYLSKNANVKYLGEIEHGNLEEIYQSSDIFILPSYKEGLPTVMLEAMASGLPIIISDVGGVSEILSNQKSAIIIQPRDTNGLRNAMTILIENEEIRRRIGENAYELSKKYSWERIAERIITIYNENTTYRR